MKLPRPAKAVVFDMDGLLIDTEAVFREVMAEASQALGLTLPDEVFLAMVGLSGHASRAIALAHFGTDFDVEPWLAHAWELAHARMADGVPVKAGVERLLDVLERAGVPRAVATSSSHAAVERHLGPPGLLGRFDAVIAAGDYALGKPSPDPFLAAAKALGAQPADCLALEDSHNGVRAAAAAGMMTIMVPDLLPATAEMRSLCVGVAASLTDVAALFAPG